jgi:anthranilate phosphoribosyltransferase
MAISYILINVETGSEREILEVLEQIPEVKEAHSVYGEYDIIARLEADTIRLMSYAYYIQKTIS